jgi:outer membrane protein assembly factor BamB
LDKRTGQALWTYNIKQDGNQSSFHGRILMSGSLVLVGTDRGTDPAADGHIYAFEAATGQVVWKSPMGTGVSTDLLLDGFRLIAYGANGELFALDLRSGKPLWTKKIDDPGSDNYMPSPVLIDHTVFAATPGGSVVAVQSRDGASLWRTQLGPCRDLQLASINSGLYVMNSGNVVYSDKYLFRLSRSSGQITKRDKLPASLSFTPSEAADSFVIQLSDHTLRRIGINGILWTVKAGGELTTHQPLVLQNQVIVADATGKIAAWRLEDGAPQWSTVFKDLKAPITTIGADSEMLYVGTQDGTLQAIRIPGLPAKEPGSKDSRGRFKKLSSELKRD